MVFSHTAEGIERTEAAAERSLGVRKGEWLFLLHGLWWWDLRPGEALSLSWDEWHDGLTVDLTRGSAAEDSREASECGRNELKPIVPEFAEMLLPVPEDRRTRFVSLTLNKSGRFATKGARTTVLRGQSRRSGNLLASWFHELLGSSMRPLMNCGGHLAGPGE